MVAHPVGDNRMTDSSEDLDEQGAHGSGKTDPRLTAENVRRIENGDDGGTVLLVGVVHDHPASVFRAAKLVESVQPEILALELPPLALPLFRLYAADDYTPPRMGGEMSAAIQQFENDRTVGIDAPNETYFRHLFDKLRAEGVTANLIRELLPSVATGVAQALSCRFGAVLGRLTPFRLRVYRVFDHEASFLDAPEEQARDEAKQISREVALLRAIELPRGMQLVETAREESMAARLRELRTQGDVIAIVGREHLEGLYSKLRGPTNN